MQKQKVSAFLCCYLIGLLDNCATNLLRLINSMSFHFRTRTHGQKGTQICDLLANKCPKGHDSVSKTWEIYLTRGHLFDSEGHLFDSKGHLFEMVGHLFDREGHLFDWKGHLFDSEGHLFEMVGHLFEMVGHLFDREGHLFDRKGHQF